MKKKAKEKAARRRLDADFYSIVEGEGGKFVKVHGYAYYADCELEEDKPFRGVEFRHFYIPIELFPNDWEATYDQALDECAQDIVDLSARECDNYLHNYYGESILCGSDEYGKQPKPLEYRQITPDTPVGFYINL